MGKEKLLMLLVNVALKYLTADRVKKWVSFGVHEIQEAIKNDGVNDWKDSVVLPILDTIEKAFDLEED